MKHFWPRFAPLVLFLVLLATAVFSRDFKRLWWRIAGQDEINPAALTGQYDPLTTNGEYLGKSVASTQLPEFAFPILGATDLPKHIEVDLTNQKVYAFEGNQKVYEFLISSGKWAPTPTGTFRIWGKFKYTKMSGGNKAIHTYYYLPNVPYVMFFSNNEIAASRGFSLHGTYWHNNFGHPMSHGCVNMRTEDAKVLFYWTDPSANGTNYTKADKENPGTEIIIYGQAPRT